MKERVAIVFLTLSVAATLGLGGAVAYAFTHRGSTTFQTSGGAGQTYTTTNSGAPGGGGPTITSGGHSSGPGASSGGGRKSNGGGGGSSSSHTGKPSSTSGAGTGVSKGVITVGGIYDETGPVDATVERDTVRSYFDLVNSQGGVNGYKFRLLDCNSAYDPSTAHQCSQKLTSEGVLAIVGWLSLSGEQPEAQYLTQQGIPIIGGLGVPAEFASPLSFPTTPSLVTQGTALGTRACQTGLSKPGVIFLDANFIAPVKQSFLDAMKKCGISPAGVETVAATKADYTDIILKFQSAGAQSVAAFVDPFSYARIFQAMERQNWHPAVLGGGLDKASANQQYASGCGSNCAVFGADSATPVLEYLDHANTPSIAQYLATVHKYYPSQYGALDAYTTYQWLAAEVLVQAVKNIGNNPVTRQSLVASLDRLRNFDDGGITKPITYGSGNHDPLHCLQWIHNTNGHWKTQSSWNCF